MRSKSHVFTHNSSSILYTLSFILFSLIITYCHQAIGGTHTVLAFSSLETSSFQHQWSDTTAYDSQSQAIINSIITPQTLYFAADGNDDNSGLDSKHPKKNPTDYLRNGNCKLLLKSGDIFTPNYNLSVGSNTYVSTYGGTQRAVINWVPINSTPFELFDADNGIYYAPIDKITDEHYKISWIKTQGNNTVNWQKVFSYSELSNDKSFYSDKDKKIIYIKSSDNLSGCKFAFASSAGGITVKNSSNCLIDNLEIVGGGLGININNSNNIVIKNCYVHHVGGIEGINQSNGTYYRYGNGIQIWADNTHNICICNNYVSDCFDAGISPQISGAGHKPSDSIFIYNNYVDRCLYCIEFYENNPEKNIPLTNVFITNNILTNAMDITNGFRYATYGFTSYLCSWQSVCDKTRFTISNNLGYGTSEFACAFYIDTPNPINTFSNNTLIVKNKSSIPDCIKNPDFYHGNSSDIIPLKKLHIKKDTIESYIKKYTSHYNKNNLFFKYLASSF